MQRIARHEPALPARILMRDACQASDVWAIAEDGGDSRLPLSVGISMHVWRSPVVRRNAFEGLGALAAPASVLAPRAEREGAGARADRLGPVAPRRAASPSRGWPGGPQLRSRARGTRDGLPLRCAQPQLDQRDQVDHFASGLAFLGVDLELCFGGHLGCAHDVLAALQLLARQLENAGGFFIGEAALVQLVFLQSCDDALPLLDTRGLGIVGGGLSRSRQASRVCRLGRTGSEIGCG